MEKIRHLSKDIEGEWISDNVFLPSILKDEIGDWAEQVKKLASAFPDQVFVISSIVHALTGAKREPDGSHARHLALDLAPMFSRTQTFDPSGRQPRLGDQRPLLAFIAGIAGEFSFGIVSEGDHFHLDKRYPPGSYAYSTHRDAYARDAANLEIRTLPTEKHLFKCAPDGRILPITSLKY